MMTVSGVSNIGVFVQVREFFFEVHNFDGFFYFSSTETIPKHFTDQLVMLVNVDAKSLADALKLREFHFNKYLIHV